MCTINQVSGANEMGVSALFLMVSQMSFLRDLCLFAILLPSSRFAFYVQHSFDIITFISIACLFLKFRTFHIQNIRFYHIIMICSASKINYYFCSSYQYYIYFFVVRFWPFCAHRPGSTIDLSPLEALVRLFPCSFIYQNVILK